MAIVSSESTRCSVYWIHLKSHTDIFSQGYVGITTETVEQRFKRHKWDALSGRSLNTNIRKAILKYGDDLIVSTILVASSDYCMCIENKLRPNMFIGWNVAEGGGGNTGGRTGIPHSEETKQKIRDGNKGLIRSEETCCKISASKAGKKAHPNMLIGCKRFFKEKFKPWDSYAADKGVWLCADIAYTLVTETGIGETRLANFFGVPDSKTVTLTKKIKQGWNPLIDPSWIAFKEKEMKNVCDSYSRRDDWELRKISRASR